MEDIAERHLAIKDLSVEKAMPADDRLEIIIRPACVRWLCPGIKVNKHRKSEAVLNELCERLLGLVRAWQLLL